MNEKRKLIPSREQYQQTLNDLIEKKDLTTLVTLRLGCELGLSRLEIVNLRISDIDRMHKRGLYVEVAKKVKRGSKYVMRSREIPINASLYQLLISYTQHGQKYVLRRLKGDINNTLVPRYINHLYEKNNIPWSNHKSRHYFKNQIWDWMRNNRQVDPGLVKDMMGHKKTVNENYGSISWDYKIEVIDKVFS